MGILLLLVLVRAHAGIWRWIPGLLVFGTGVGTMLTSSVNVVQSSFPDKDQGDISGLSRSVSNLGSSLGTALVGSVLVAVKLPEGKPFAVALTVMLVIAWSAWSSRSSSPVGRPTPQDQHPRAGRLRPKRWAPRHLSRSRLPSTELSQSSHGVPRWLNGRFTLPCHHPRRERNHGRRPPVSEATSRDRAWPKCEASVH